MRQKKIIWEEKDHKPLDEFIGDIMNDYHTESIATVIPLAYRHGMYSVGGGLSDCTVILKAIIIVNPANIQRGG